MTTGSGEQYTMWKMKILWKGELNADWLCHRKLNGFVLGRHSGAQMASAGMGYSEIKSMEQEMYKVVWMSPRCQHYETEDLQMGGVENKVGQVGLIS